MSPFQFVVFLLLVSLPRNRKIRDRWWEASTLHLNSALESRDAKPSNVYLFRASAISRLLLNAPFDTLQEYRKALENGDVVVAGAIEQRINSHFKRG